MERKLHFSLLTTCLITFSCLGTLTAQENATTDSLLIDSLQAETQNAYRVNGYSRYQPPVATGAISTLTRENFNQGYISDPLLLLQGKLPGVQIYNRGGDPNGASVTRIRGLSGGRASEPPLIVVDGIAGAALENLDPNDIASVSVLKDAAAQAIYGTRGANGVIIINTVANTYDQDTFRVHYSGQYANSNIAMDSKVFTAAEFRAIGGADIGASTNWLDAITRTGTSQMHNLAVDGKKGSTYYRLGGTYRAAEGILQNSGFDKYNLRLALRSSLIQDKLNISLRSAYSSNERRLGFREAFQYASTFNPTAPILGANSTIYPFNGTPYGGYYEAIGLFEAYNPVAIVNLNENNSLVRTWTSTVHLDYLLTQNLSVNLRYTAQADFENRREFYSPFSLFGGNARSAREERKGSARLRDVRNDFTLTEAYLNWNKQTGKQGFNWTLGTSYHDGFYAYERLRLDGFRDREILSLTELGDTRALVDSANASNRLAYDWNDLLFSVFSQLHWNMNDKVHANFALRYDGSSKLGRDAAYATYTSLGLAFDLKEIFRIDHLDGFRLRAGYGTTGGLPERGDLGLEAIMTIDRVAFTEERTIWSANPVLSAEQKQEFNLGVDFAQGGFFGSVDWYNKQITGMIDLFEFDFFSPRYENGYSLSAQGIDIRLNAVTEGTNLRFTSGIALSFYQSEFEDLEFIQHASNSGGTFQNPIITFENGQPLGTIYAPQFTGTLDANGFPIYEDLNNDGFLDISSFHTVDDDLANLGSGVPDVELGWYNQLVYRDWELSFFFRGAFGHLLANRQRQFQEPESNSIPFSNQMTSELAAPGLRSRAFSSLFVEQADFLKLDYLTLAKSFEYYRGRQMRISLTGQNLLVFTNYLGADPEPALVDIGQDASFVVPFELGLSTDVFAAGIDRQDSYRPSRTITFGLRLEI